MTLADKPPKQIQDELCMCVFLLMLSPFKLIKATRLPRFFPSPIIHPSATRQISCVWLSLLSKRSAICTTCPATSGAVWASPPLKMRVRALRAVRAGTLPRWPKGRTGKPRTGWRGWATNRPKKNGERTAFKTAITWTWDLVGHGALQAIWCPKIGWWQYQKGPLGTSHLGMSNYRLPVEIRKPLFNK